MAHQLVLAMKLRLLCERFERCKCDRHTEDVYLAEAEVSTLRACSTVLAQCQYMGDAQLDQIWYIAGLSDFDRLGWYRSDDPYPWLAQDGRRHTLESLSRVLDEISSNGNRLLDWSDHDRLKGITALLSSLAISGSSGFNGVLLDDLVIASSLTAFMCGALCDGRSRNSTVQQMACAAR